MRVFSTSACVLLLAVSGLGGCASALVPSMFEGATPEMRPDVFFRGKTVSSGVVENRAGAPTHRFKVEGRGQVLPDGTFRLEQIVSFDQEIPRSRTWLMQKIDAHHYRATLTDASGPVEAEAYGNLFHLRYPMQTPLGGWMEQWMYLQPDGSTVINEAAVSVFGVVAAHLSERITHDDGADR